MPALIGAALLAVGCGGDGTTGPTGPAGPAGTAGPKGDVGEEGTPGKNDPQITLVTPNLVYLQRTVDVAISGDDTEWNDATTVDFGPGISVDELIANPAGLIATITIDETADLGARDIVVTGGANGAGALTFAGAFKVEAPLYFQGYAGSLAQGSIFIGRVEQLDKDTPFDVAGDPDNGYPYLTMMAAPGIEPQISQAQPTIIDFVGLVDVTATTGDIDLRVTSGLDNIESLAPAAMPIAARSPMALANGTNSGSVSVALESYLYSYAPGAHKLVNITAYSPSNPDATPYFALLPSSGSFADLVSYGPTGTIVTETADPIYVIVWDNSGASGYSFDVEIDTKDSDDTEPNNACDMAQAVAPLPAALQNLTISGQTDEDWFVIDAAAADVGSLVRVTTKAGEPFTDTYVDVFSGDCQNLISLGGPSSDVDYHEDFTSKPIPAAGKIYIKVSNSPFYPWSGALYDLDISIVPTEKEPNDTCAMANAIAKLPSDLAGLTIADELDEDWFALTIGPADVGKHLQIVTSPGDPVTDAFVEVYSGTCASLMLYGESSDADYHESLLTSPLPTTGTYYVKISNSPVYPYSGADYNLSLALVDPFEAEPNNTCAQAQNNVPMGQDAGPLFIADATDEDWLVFMAAAGDVGKTVHVVTTGGDFNTDTLVEVFEGSCAALVSLGGPSDDAGYHEDWVSNAITAAGPIYVKVSNSPFGFAGSEYNISVTFE